MLLAIVFVNAYKRCGIFLITVYFKAAICFYLSVTLYFYYNPLATSSGAIPAYEVPYVYLIGFRSVFVFFGYFLFVFR